MTSGHKHIYNIDSYTPTEKDVFLIDANIWITLLDPLYPEQVEHQDRYSKFIIKLQRKKARIVVCSKIISEFINRALRLEYDEYLVAIEKTKQDYSFKEYKKTDSYKDTMNYSIKQVKERIFKLASPTNDCFDTIDFLMLCKDIENHDFNDKYFLQLAEEKDYKILTNIRVLSERQSCHCICDRLK